MSHLDLLLLGALVGSLLANVIFTHRLARLSRDGAVERDWNTGADR